MHYMHATLFMIHKTYRRMLKVCSRPRIGSGVAELCFRAPLLDSRIARQFIVRCKNTGLTPKKEIRPLKNPTRLLLEANRDVSRRPSPARKLHTKKTRTAPR